MTQSKESKFRFGKRVIGLAWPKVSSRLFPLTFAAAFMLLCLLAIAAEVSGPPPPTVILDKGFRLSKSWGDRETLEFRLTAPARLTLEATWTGPAPRLALILNGPGQTAAYARRDGGSPLRLEYQVTAEDLRRGDTWLASIVNFSQQGPIEGLLRVLYPAGVQFTCTFLGDYPRDREPGWSEDCQGLANDDDNWFITQMERIWKFPVSHDLNRSVSGPDPAAGISLATIPRALRSQGYNHFGDPDVHEGRLFVPLEPTQPCKIVVFSAQTLAYLGAADLDQSQQNSAPWCAINPAEGLLYSSNFDNVDSLCVYRPEFTEGRPSLRFLRRFPLLSESGAPLRLNRVQGGAFSRSSGLLYLICDTAGSGGGMFVFDVRTGRKVARVPISYSPGFPNYQELEGVTVWNLESARAPNVRGQVHVVLIENDILSADDLWVKHFRVSCE